MFNIRRANANDVEALVALRIALLREIGNLASVGEAGLADLVEAHRRYFARSIIAETYIGFVAVADSAVAGNGGMVLIDRAPYVGNLLGRDAYLMNMYTTPEWRRHGICSRILSEILTFAKQVGVKRVWLHSELEARTLYERAGFIPKNSEMEICL